MTTTTPTPSSAAIPPPRIDIEWLAQNCYIQFPHEGDGYLKEDWYKDEAKVGADRVISYRICEVCHRSSPDWMRFHCYMNNGKDRQTMTMCMQQCYYDYQQKRYELLGSAKPTGGVIAISARARVEDLVMTTLMKMHATADSNDNDDHNDNNVGDLFYDAVAMAYDQSPAVREYFRNDRSRTQPSNKGLWPLRYRAFKELGV